MYVSLVMLLGTQCLTLKSDEKRREGTKEPIVT